MEPLGFLRSVSNAWTGWVGPPGSVSGYLRPDAVRSPFVCQDGEPLVDGTVPMVHKVFPGLMGEKEEIGL